MRSIAPIVAGLLLSLLLAVPSRQLAATTDEPEERSPAPERSLVILSDLHMGLGRDAEGAWHPTEDFRWPVALEGFLDALPREGSGPVDLLIAGDFLELWQPPESVRCTGPPGDPAEAGNGPGRGDYGCTVEELATIAGEVIRAHRRELAALARFAAQGGNCLVVIPGNHDAALILDPVWKLLEKPLTADGGCVRRVADGVWSSPDGRVVVEHGHQIGHDANKYPDWPRLSRRFGDRDYVWQPWGEGFVQAIFNDEEASFPLIDNLSPSSAGVRYRMAESGLSASAKDVAAFLRFNLFDTTLQQKVQILGPGDGDPGGEPPRWDLEKARGLGHRLFAGALGADDPFARALKHDDAEEWAQLRAELDRLARTLPQDELSSLCDQLAIRGGKDSCERPTLGHTVSELLISREREMRRHLEQRQGQLPRLKTFVYGHTHSFELPWKVRVDPVTTIRVTNSGAFQRLLDDGRLRQLASQAETEPGAYLRRRSLEGLPACYTSVHVSRDGDPEVLAWYMPEDAPAGRFVDPCEPPCPRVGHGCGE